MKLDKFYKLQNKLETFSFEVNFKSLSKTLYYFSFLGNIFSVIFSYFFIKNVTDSIPALFPLQDLFFSIFVILFMVGYELFKRFSFEQLTTSILRSTNKFTLNIILGFTITLGLVIGSFYLSLQGAHRMIDTSSEIEVKTDNLISNRIDSIANYYDKEIEYYRKQPAKTRADRKYRDSIVAVLQTTKETKVQNIEQKIIDKSSIQVEILEQNSFAFAAIVFFLEFIILIGVAFNAYYEWISYTDMKTLLNKPQFSQLDLNLRLLKILYQNGRKKEQDPAVSKSKMISLAYNSKIKCHKKDIDSFMALCNELEIITGGRRNKIYNVSYEKAKTLLENQEVL
jgi:hypothetical protein